MPAPPSHVLVVTGDPSLGDPVRRLAEAAGLSSTVVPAAPSPGEWLAADLVVVGSDCVAGLADRLPRRRGVVVALAEERDTAAWSAAVALGAESVVVLPGEEAHLLGLLTAGATGASPPAPLVAVVGGRGGAGATTLACALAGAGARRRLRTVLVDADPLGGGIELALGAEGSTGLRWSELPAGGAGLPPSALTRRLAVVDGVHVLACERDGSLEVPAQAVAPALAAVRSDADLVVADLPRHLGAAGRLVLEAATLALLVVPAELRAAAAAAQVAALVRSTAVELQVVVRGPAPGGLDAELVAGALGLPLSGELRAEPGIEVSFERGVPPGRGGRGPLAAYCARLLDRVAPLVDPVAG